MKLVVGLGNPGRTYSGTRHNVGWMVLERMAALQNTMISRRLRRRLQVIALYGDFEYETQVIRLVKPQTMMNRSGEVFAMLGDSVRLDNALLVCDDVNLPLGSLRIRAHGSSGGHKGLQSCIDILGSDRIARLRFGIGGGGPGCDLADYVLSKFSREEVPLVEKATERAVETIETWIRLGIEVAMNRHNMVHNA